LTTIPSPGGSSYADAKQRVAGNIYVENKRLERSAELSNLGPRTSCRIGRRPYTPTRRNTVRCGEGEVEEHSRKKETTCPRKGKQIQRQLHGHDRRDPSSWG
jgi:hypothetical protein